MTAPQPRPLQLREAGALRALLWLPPHAGSALALLCFLHGHGEAAPMELYAALSLHGPLFPGAPRESTDRFAILAPQLPRPGDLWLHYAEDLRALVVQLERERNADPERRYLTGFSFGGNGVFDLGLRQPKLWNALWAVDPTRPPDPALAQPVWLSIGDAARRRQREFIENLRSQTPQAPPHRQRRVHLDEGEDHVGCARRAYADPRIYEWLLGWS